MSIIIIAEIIQAIATCEPQVFSFKFNFYNLNFSEFEITILFFFNLLFFYRNNEKERNWPSLNIYISSFVWTRKRWRLQLLARSLALSLVPL